MKGTHISTFEERTKNEYFEWLCDIIAARRYNGSFSFSKLLRNLHETDFIYTIHRDRNRADDGLDLRFRFGNECNCLDDSIRYLRGPCSILEMMIGLSLRCEETIMSDVSIGDRTAQWFWGMVTNLGLGSMYNSRFDKRQFDICIHRFLNHEYDRDGKGGLFTVRNSRYDMRNEEIWNQLSWYLDRLT